ncbi:MAG TPA: hemerythrin domain-containing protein [Burkholderiales bacterium]|nr:hemerythrin domain-containing protein [Burkholderiales bacterium]
MRSLLPPRTGERWIERPDDRLRVSIVGTPSPGADFDHPLEMLEACHDRIEERLQTLERLAGHLPQHGADEQARQAAANVMRYFDTAGEHHHQDEERDVFPAIRSHAGDARTLDLIDGLQRDHDRMRVLWSALRERLSAIASGACAALEGAAVAEFAATYRRHIAREESELLPLAARVLRGDEQAAIGTTMAVRRGVKR